MSFHRITLNMFLSSGLALFASACPSSEDDTGEEEASATPVSVGNTSTPLTSSTTAGTGATTGGTDTTAATGTATEGVESAGSDTEGNASTAGPTSDGQDTSTEASAGMSGGETTPAETAGETAGPDPEPEPEPELPTFLPTCEEDSDCPNDDDVCGSHGFCASPCETHDDCTSGLSCVMSGYCVPVCGIENPCPPRCPTACEGDACPDGCPEACAGRSCPEELGVCQIETDERLGNGPVCVAPE